MYIKKLRIRQLTEKSRCEDASVSTFASQMQRNVIGMVCFENSAKEEVPPTTSTSCKNGTYASAPTQQAWNFRLRWPKRKMIFNGWNFAYVETLIIGLFSRILAPR